MIVDHEASDFSTIAPGGHSLRVEVMVRQQIRLFSIITFLVLPALLAACIGTSQKVTIKSYTADQHSRQYPAGQTLPGTGIQYIGPVEDRGAELRIDGQVAYKKAADSVDWQGSPLPGVSLELNQRVLWYNEENLHLGGGVRIAVEAPNPQALSTPPSGSAEFTVPTTYEVKVGETVPGTQLTLKSIDPERGAEFTGWPDGRVSLPQGCRLGTVGRYPPTRRRCGERPARGLDTRGCYTTRGRRPRFPLALTPAARNPEGRCNVS